MNRLFFIILVFLVGCKDDESGFIMPDTLVLAGDYTPQERSFPSTEEQSSILIGHFQESAASTLSDWVTDRVRADTGFVLADRVAGDFGPSRIAAFNILAGNDEARAAWLQRFNWQGTVDAFLGAFAALNTKVSATVESESLIGVFPEFNVRAGFIDELATLIGFSGETYPADAADSLEVDNTQCLPEFGAAGCAASYRGQGAIYEASLQLALNLADKGFANGESFVKQTGEDDFITVAGFARTGTYQTFTNTAGNFLRWDIEPEGLSLLRIEPKNAAELQALFADDFFNWLSPRLVANEIRLVLPGDWQGSGEVITYRVTEDETSQLGDIVQGEISQAYLTRLNPTGRILISTTDFSENQTVEFSAGGLSVSQSSRQTMLNLDPVAEAGGFSSGTDGGGSSGLDFTLTNPGSAIPCFADAPVVDIRSALYVLLETGSNLPLSYFAVKDLAGEKVEKNGFRRRFHAAVGPNGVSEFFEPPRVEFAYNLSGTAPSLALPVNAMCTYAGYFSNANASCDDYAVQCPVGDSQCAAELLIYPQAFERHVAEYSSGLAEYRLSADWLLLAAEFAQLQAELNDTESCFSLDVDSADYRAATYSRYLNYRASLSEIDPILL